VGRESRKESASCAVECGGGLVPLVGEQTPSAVPSDQMSKDSPLVALLHCIGVRSGRVKEQCGGERKAEKFILE